MMEAVHQHLIDVRAREDARKWHTEPGIQARSTKPKRPEGMSGRQFKRARKAFRRDLRAMSPERLAALTEMAACR